MQESHALLLASRSSAFGDGPLPGSGSRDARSVRCSWSARDRYPPFVRRLVDFLREL